MNDEQTLKLREILLNEFSEEELASFAAELGLDYATLPGEGQFGKTREMFMILREQDRLQALKSRLRALRPAAYDAAGLNLVAPAPENARRLPIPLAWLVLGLVAVLIVVCALTFLLRPGSTPASPATATSEATSDAALTGEPTLLAEPTIAGSEVLTNTNGAATDPLDPNATAEGEPTEQSAVATLVVVATSIITPEVAATPAESPTPAPPTATPTVSETNPAALAVIGANAQLIPYFQGKADQASLTGWQGVALQSVVSFSRGALLRRLKIAEADRATLASSVTYPRRPMLVTQRNDTTFIVDSREAWTYQTGPSNIVCETSDYRYTIVKDGDAYRVAGSTSKLVSSTCQ